MNGFFQALSVFGAALILAAYVLLQRGRIRSTDWSYLLANLLGALALTVVAVNDRRLGFIILEAAWAATSLWGMIARRKLSAG